MLVIHFKNKETGLVNLLYGKINYFLISLFHTFDSLSVISIMPNPFETVNFVNLELLLFSIDNLTLPHDLYRVAIT